MNEYHGLNFRIIQFVCLGVGVVDVLCVKGCGFMCFFVVVCLDTL